jgi:hypothetical protein
MAGSLVLGVMRMISLSRPEIEALIDLPQAAIAIEDAYRAISLGQANLPPVGHIIFPVMFAGRRFVSAILHGTCRSR